MTLHLPKGLLRKARHIAVDRGQSLSAYLTELLTQAVDRERAYEAARKRQTELMDKGVNLGTHGTIDWRREELHAR